MSMLCFMPPHIRSAATYCSHFQNGVQFHFRRDFYSLHRFFKNLKSKSLGNTRVFGIRLNTPKGFCEKHQFGGIAFADFLAPKNSLKLKKSMSFYSLRRFLKKLKSKSLVNIRDFCSSHDIPTFFAKILNFGISLLPIF